MEAVAIRYEYLGKSSVVGKVVNRGNGQVFFTTADERGLLREDDGFSFAPEIVTLLEKEGITRIEVYYKPERRLYQTDTHTVRRYGRLKSMSPGIGPRWHLPRRYFSAGELTHWPPFLSKELVVTATPSSYPWTSSESRKPSLGTPEDGAETATRQLRLDWVVPTGNRDLSQQAIEAAKKLGKTIGRESTPPDSQ